MTNKQTPANICAYTADSPPERWHEIVVEIDRDDTDLVTAKLLMNGFVGLEERACGPNTIKLVVFVQSDSASGLQQAMERAKTVTAGHAKAPLASADLDEAVWKQNWRSHFPRLRIGRALEVIPPWETADQSFSTVVINPGLAFGTGHHETTAACLALLEPLVGAQTRLADIGCGSGIIAIAAAKLGAAFCFATDNDDTALVVARENVTANHVDSTVSVAAVPCTNDAASYGPGPYHIVVANILAHTLIDIHLPLTSVVAPDGFLLLSGIEKQRASLVENAFIDASFSLNKRIEKGDWVSLALHRQDKAPISKK